MQQRSFFLVFSILCGGKKMASHTSTWQKSHRYRGQKLRCENDGGALRNTRSQPCGQQGFFANIPRNYNGLVGLSARQVRACTANSQENCRPSNFGCRQETGGRPGGIRGSSLKRKMEMACRIALDGQPPRSTKRGVHFRSHTVELRTWPRSSDG